LKFSKNWVPLNSTEKVSFQDQTSSSLKGWHGGQLSEVGELVVEEDATFDSLLGDDRDAAAAAGTAVTVDGQRHALLHLLTKNHWRD
jgi:hypothetical protein